MNMFLISLAVYAVLFALQFCAGAFIFSDAANEKRGLKHLVQHGINPNNTQEVKAFFVKRYDSDRFNNRISDFAGWVLTVLTTISAIVVFCGYWYGVYDLVIKSGDGSVLVGLSIWSAFVYFGSIFYSWVCKLLTGRYPREAQKARKNILPIFDTVNTLEGFTK